MEKQNVLEKTSYQGIYGRVSQYTPNHAPPSPKHVIYSIRREQDDFNRSQ